MTLDCQKVSEKVTIFTATYQVHSLTSSSFRFFQPHLIFFLFASVAFASPHLVIVLGLFGLGLGLCLLPLLPAGVGQGVDLGNSGLDVGDHGRLDHQTPGGEDLDAGSWAGEWTGYSIIIPDIVSHLVSWQVMAAPSSGS